MEHTCDKFQRGIREVFFHFFEVFEKCIEYIRIFFIHFSFRGDFKMLVKTDIFYKNFMAHFLESPG